MKKACIYLARQIVKGAIYLYCKIVYRMKVEGSENIPKQGALIFCANHRSYLDPPMMVCTAKRHVRFLAKKELYKSKFLAFLGFVFAAIPVNRDAKDMSAIKTSLKALKDGECIALFPEGTRNGMEKGEKTKGGAAFFALNANAKVIPVGIRGELKPFHRVTIQYGKPMDFTSYHEKRKEKETVEKVTEEIMNQIVMLTNEKD